MNTQFSCAKAPYFFVEFVGKILLLVALLKICVLHKQIGRKVRTGSFPPEFVFAVLAKSTSLSFLIYVT